MEIWPRWCGFPYFHSQSSVCVVKPLHPPHAPGSQHQLDLVQHSSRERPSTAQTEAEHRVRTAAGNLRSQRIQFILRLAEGVKYHTIQVTQRKDTGTWTEKQEDKRPYCKSCLRDRDAGGRRRSGRGGYTLYYSPLFEFGMHSEAWAVNPVLQWLVRKVTVCSGSMNELIVCLHSRRKGIIYLQRQYFSNSVGLVHTLGMEEAAVLLELPFNR